MDSDISKYPFLQPEVPTDSGPITLKSGNHFSKISSLGKYWNNPDKFIALVVAGSGLLCATLFGSVIFSIGLGLPLACYLSYKRSNSDVYTNSRFVIQDLYCYPKHVKEVNRLLQAPQESQVVEPRVTPSHSLGKSNAAISDFFKSQTDVSLIKNKDSSFPLHIVLLARPLNPNINTKVQVAGYICIEHISTAFDEDTRKRVEYLLSQKDLKPNELLSEFQEAGLHHDFLKRTRKDLYAYSFGKACLIRDLVVKPEFRGNGLGQVLVAHAIQKLKNMADVDVLICKENTFIAEKLMSNFYGRFYTPPKFCVNNRSLHPMLRTKTIFFPIYKHKIEYACEKALEKFVMFEKLKKNTVPYFNKTPTIEDQSSRRHEHRLDQGSQQYTVAVTSSENPSI